MSQTLSQDTADTIRAAIQSGSYRCGDRLVELTLSQELEVSQNTIRDALHILEQEGWVNKIPRRGVYIPTFTTAEAQEIYALWQAVETLALEWAVQHITETEGQRLRETMITAEQKVYRQEWGHANLAINHLHTAIAIHANAPRTHMILSRIHNQTHLLEIQRMRLIPLTMDEWDIRIETYFDLIHEVEHKNIDRAQKYLKQAIQYEAELVIPYLE